MKKKKRGPRALVEAAVWLAVLGFVGFRAWPQLAAAAGLGAAGPEVSDISVATLAGDSITLSELRGQVVLVNFWATWCPPCRVEMPGFERVYNRYRAEGFEIVALSTDRGPRDVVHRFVEERGLSFPIAMATSQSVHAFGGVRGLPISFLIDRQGRIRHTVQGIFAEPALDRAVARLLAEESTPEDP